MNDFIIIGGGSPRVPRVRHPIHYQWLAWEPNHDCPDVRIVVVKKRGTVVTNLEMPQNWYIFCVG